MAVRTSTKNASSKTGAKFSCAIASLRARADTMDEMEEAVVAQASSTMRSRAAPTRFHFTDTTSTPAVGDAVFVKLGAGYHKAVIKEIWHTSEPPMYECVHASTSLHAGTAQAVPEDDITPACGTYRQYKCARESVQLSPPRKQWLATERVRKRASVLRSPKEPRRSSDLRRRRRIRSSGSSTATL